MWVVKRFLSTTLSFLIVIPVTAQTNWTAITTNDNQVEQLFQQLGKDSNEPLLALRRLADSGRADANFALAKAYSLGISVAQSDTEARVRLKQGVEQNHAESMLAEAMLSEAEGKEEALYLYSRAAELGHPLAQLRLGRCNENDELGLGRNQVMATRFYRLAHEAGLPVATYELGRCYRDGIGVSPDALISTRLIRQAAEARVPAACRLMAESYAAGIGIDRDNVAAVGWLMYAAQLGDRDAVVQLGTRFEEGDGVIQNLNQAGTYYSSAAQRGDQVAQYRLAMLYIDGRGTKSDPIRGYVLLDAIRGLPPADAAFKKLEASMTDEQLVVAKKRSTERRTLNSQR